MSDIIHDTIQHTIQQSSLYKQNEGKYTTNDFTIIIENDFSYRIFKLFDDENIKWINSIISQCIYESKNISIDDIHHEMTFIDDNIHQHVINSYKYLDEIKQVCKQKRLTMIMGVDDKFTYNTKYNLLALREQIQNIPKPVIYKLHHNFKYLHKELYQLMNDLYGDGDLNHHMMIKQNLDNLFMRYEVIIHKIIVIYDDTEDFIIEIKNRIAQELSQKRKQCIMRCSLSILYIIIISLCVFAIVY